MKIEQNFKGCLASEIGRHGLSRLGFDMWLERAGQAAEKLRSNPPSTIEALVELPKREDDIEALEQAFDRLIEGARTVVLFGTGGSSLGGQALAQMGGWYIPGEKPRSNQMLPRFRIYDNLDPRSLELGLQLLDMETTRFVVISKSGRTAETLLQTLVAMKALQEAGLGDRLDQHFLGITEFKERDKRNGLRELFQDKNIPLLPHDPEIGGRFSCLTNVGLLPALARGLDIRAIRHGAAQVIDQLHSFPTASDFTPAMGAAIAIGLNQEQRITNNVMMPYADRLSRFAAWYVQLVAESLGKQEAGLTPTAALGPVDQHSQLQLFMDGPRQHLVTILSTKPQKTGSMIDPELAKMAGIEDFGGRYVGDLIEAQSHSVARALTSVGRPVRTIDIHDLDEMVMGQLMMEYMIETILMAELLEIDAFDQPAVEIAKSFAWDYIKRS